MHKLNLFLHVVLLEHRFLLPRLIVKTQELYLEILNSFLSITHLGSTFIIAIFIPSQGKL